MGGQNSDFRWGVDVNEDHRHFQENDDGLVTVSLNEKNYQLLAHSFWPKFAGGWEPDTRLVYQSFVREGATVVDIGGWIGPTVLFADAAGASKILVVEPNPGSYKMIGENIQLNPSIAAKTTLVSVAICDENGPISIGLDDEEDDTSVCSIQGDDFVVEGMTIETLLNVTGFTDIDFLKIDTEGAEILMADQMGKLDRFGDPVVHLSVHVPFWPADRKPDGLISALARYDLFDDRGQELSHAEISTRLCSTESHPAWGTRHGNFFEIVMLPQNKK